MGHFPFTIPPLMVQDFISLEGPWSIGQSTGSWGARSSTAWPAANRAIYIPFRVARPTFVTNSTFYNGSTVSGNGDVGIYDANGALLVSTGSLALTGVTNGSKDLNIPDIILGRGMYYFAIAVDNTTHQFVAINGLPLEQLRVMGVLQQASAFPLPSTMTPATVTSSYIPSSFLQCQQSKSVDQVGDHIVVPCMPTIHPYSIEAGGSEVLVRGGQALKDLPDGAWPGANWAVLSPFVLCETTRFQRLFVWNGGTVSGNIDLGMYWANGAAQRMDKLVSSGSVAMSGANVLQTVNIDVTLGPGTFYFGMACDNTTAQFKRPVLAGNAAFGFQASVVCWRDTSFPLPAFINNPNQFPEFMPTFGAAQKTVV